MDNSSAFLVLWVTINEVFFFQEKECNCFQWVENDMEIMGDNEQRLWEKECDEKTLEVEFNLLVEKLRRKKEIIDKKKEESCSFKK